MKPKPVNCRAIPLDVSYCQRNGYQDTVKQETATTPDATVTVQWVTKFDSWEGKPIERSYTVDVRGKGVVVDLKRDERGTVLDQEEK